MNSIPITQPTTPGHPKTKQYTSMSESIMKASNKSRSATKKGSLQENEVTVHGNMKEKGNVDIVVCKVVINILVVVS